MVCGSTVVSVANTVIFFFKQKTAYEMRISDWSSDVCSSDLVKLASVNVTDGGAQVDMAGSEVTGGTAFAGEPEVFSTNGSVTNSTGGTKIFNIRLLTRRSSGLGNSSDVTGSLGGSG